MSSRHELIGVFCGIRRGCEWPNDDGTLAIIGTVRIGQTASDAEDRQTIDIKGSVNDRSSLCDGLTYRFYGQTKEHHRYGRQFCFDSFVVDTPVGQEAVTAYLGQCKHIGPKSALTLWREYGEEAVAKLRECPEEVAAILPRFKLDHAIEASELLKSMERTEKSKMGLLGLLKGRGFPRSIIDKLLTVYGVEAASIVQRNPYCLMRFKGVGFLKADRMYLDLRHNPSRLKRQALCAWHAIASRGDGDTWFPFAVVRDGLRANIASATLDVERAIQLGTRAGLLSEVYHGGRRWLAERKKDEDEQRIADLINEARLEHETRAAPLLWGHIANELAEVTEHQRDNARLATAGFIGVLAGRPGTGKTYTVARMVSLLKDMVGESGIAIAAPTGKAAVRVTAAMRATGLSITATTIHSLLGFSGGDGFRHDRENPIDAMFIIVDEASMIDTALMRSLLEARGEGSHILFVGDPNQLAPVGHGAPLRDLIACGQVPTGTLTEIQRNSGRIVRACHEIIDQRRLNTSPKLDVDAGENLLLIERDSAESQIETLTAVMQKYQRDESLDPIWDFQIIVAVNAKSPLGRKPLNAMLQHLLNADGRSVPGNPFRVGDKIINTKNGEYALELPPDDDDNELTAITNAETGRVYVANGEQAEVLDVAPTKIIARLTSPDRIILIPRANHDPDRPTGDDSEEAIGTGCTWELGYAISCHKSQGSEWPVVLVMLDDYAGAKMVCSRQWLFTAISRAKRLGLLIGKQSTANAMCGRDALFQRKTLLRERILALAPSNEDKSGSTLPDAMLTEILAGVC